MTGLLKRKSALFVCLKTIFYSSLSLIVINNQSQSLNVKVGGGHCDADAMSSEIVSLYNVRHDYTNAFESTFKISRHLAVNAVHDIPLCNLQEDTMFVVLFHGGSRTYDVWNASPIL